MSLLQAESPFVPFLIVGSRVCRGLPEAAQFLWPSVQEWIEQPLKHSVMLAPVHLRLSLSILSWFASASVPCCCFLGVDEAIYWGMTESSQAAHPRE